MEINYELIIKYLVKKDNKEEIKVKSNNFITQKNIYNYSVNFPDKFKNILTDKFYRYGITINDNENNNISFWSSILSLINKSFSIPYSLDEIELINQFKNQLVENYSKQKLSLFLKNMDKNDLRERLKLEPDIYILQYIVDVLDVNLLIFDFTTQDIWTVYHKDIMNPYKKTLLFAFNGKYWEPIMMVKVKGETEKLFDFNNMNIKKILTTENLVKYFNGDKINKEVIICEEIYDIVQQEKNKLKIKDIIHTELIDDNSESESTVKTNSDNDNNVFTEEDHLEELKKLNKTKLNKMKIDELLKLTDKLKIPIIKKNSTKAILIEKIMAKMS